MYYGSYVFRITGFVDVAIKVDWNPQHGSQRFFFFNIENFYSFLLFILCGESRVRIAVG